MRSAAHGSHQRPVITDAQEGASADLKQRQTRYAITMAFRVACFISMIWVPSPWRWILLGGAVVLPYIAVIFANQADQRTDHTQVEHGGKEIENPARNELDD